jgi:hypothetical protein
MRRDLRAAREQFRAAESVIVVVQAACDKKLAVGRSVEV